MKTKNNNQLTNNEREDLINDVCHEILLETETRGWTVENLNEWTTRFPEIADELTGFWRTAASGEILDKYLPETPEDFPSNAATNEHFEQILSNLKKDWGL